MTSEAVKVIVRCRPLNQREHDLNCKVAVSMYQPKGQCTIQADAKSPQKNFYFDGVYYIDSTTEQIYNDIAYPLVEGVTEGYNGTIFAYGQTGCGKSFTMQGITDPASQRGIIPRAFDHVFETIAVSDKAKFLVHASYLEIYNEEIRDLLGKDIKAKLDLKEHPEKGVYVAGISMHKVTNVKECQVVMDRGWKNRATGATLMNADSSRSHSIFTISLEMAEKDDNGEDHFRAGKLNLVDLAGSERQSKTGSTGDRLKEATKINLSLSALGNVISALVDGKSKHIPYRDSKLTRILQDSLGGNTKTLMVACLSPADNNYDESLSTLRYANRAKNIQNKPKINEDPKDALLRQFQEEIARLKQMLMGQIPVSLGADGAPMISERQIEEQKRAIEAEKEKIKKEYEGKLAEKEKQYEAEIEDKAKLKSQMNELKERYEAKLNKLDEQYTNLPTASQEDLQESSDSQVAALSTASGLPPETLIVGSKGDPGYIQSTEQSIASPGINTSGRISAGGDVLIVNREGAVTPDDHYTTVQPGQTAVHVKTLSAKERSAPAPPPPQNLSKEEVLMRLQKLEAGMVGGELVNNQEVVERHVKRKRHAEERQRLAKANTEMEDEGIMLEIFENIQDEVKVKSKQLKKVKQKYEALEADIRDLQTEFEFERVDYLDTIRKQERQIMLLQAILDRVQPCIRKDCNYSNIDKIKNQARWDEENNEWGLPQLVVEKTHLPPAVPGQAAGYIDPDEERYYKKLAQKSAHNRDYFMSNRANELLNNSRSSSYGADSGTSPLYSNGANDYDNAELRAAAVHGQIFPGSSNNNNQPTFAEEMGPRRPTRLEAMPLPPQSGRKLRRKRLD